MVIEFANSPSISFLDEPPKFFGHGGVKTPSALSFPTAFSLARFDDARPQWNSFRQLGTYINDWFVLLKHTS